MIRLATKTDIPQLVELYVEFLESSAYSQHGVDIDRDYLAQLVYGIIKTNYIWVWDKHSELVGMLIAVLEPNLHIPQRRVFKELIWYVKPEHRGGSTAGRMFVAFLRQGQELVDQGRAHAVATTRMATTENYDLESRGFRMTEKVYLKD